MLFRSGPADVVDAVKRICTTFPLTGPGLAAGLAALTDTEHARMVYESNRELRRRFSGELSGMGLGVFPSQTNFVLARFGDGAKAALPAHDFLVARGIVPRRLAAPAFQDCIRFTLGLDGEMRQTADALRDYLGS